MALALPAISHAASPWYERDTCRAAIKAAFDADTTALDAQLNTLERSGDLDDQACAVWVRASYSEIHIAVFGKDPPQLTARRKALTRLFQFGRTNKGKDPRFADLELEARLRRVRVLFEEGKRTDALREIKQLYEMVGKREKQPPTPTSDYVHGVLNGALAAPGWAARAILTMAGLSSDLSIAAEDMGKLMRGESVYKWDAAFVAHHFAEEVPDGPFKPAATYTGLLLQQFPANPQWALDHAFEHHHAKKYADANAALAPIIARLDAKPDLWSARIRAKLFWLAGRIALDAGDRPAAKKLLARATAQGWRDEGYGERIDELSEALGS